MCLWCRKISLVKEGCHEPGNVCVVGSGKFILSSLTFSEYFNKSRSQDGVVDSSEDVTLSPKSPNKETVLFIPDFSEPYPLYPKILKQYFSENCPDKELIIYVSKRDSTPMHIQFLNEILQRYESVDCNVILQTGQDWDEHVLFQYADYFITTRCRETVFRTCLADLFRVQIIYGTDEPLFPGY